MPSIPKAVKSSRVVLWAAVISGTGSRVDAAADEVGRECAGLDHRSVQTEHADFHVVVLTQCLERPRKESLCSLAANAGEPIHV